MTDLSKTIEPKSDQLNADDLIAGARTIRITRVTGNSDSQQPISIHFEGDNKRPYKPCKSMRRVLVKLWGEDGASYVGKSLTLFCDPNVVFAGEKVGGIRISHMSDIDGDSSVLLTTTRSKRAPYQVKRLTGGEKQSGDIDGARRMLEAANCETIDEVRERLLGLQWTAAEKAEIKGLVEAARERKPS